MRQECLRMYLTYLDLKEGAWNQSFLSRAGSERDTLFHVFCLLDKIISWGLEFSHPLPKAWDHAGHIVNTQPIASWIESLSPGSCCSLHRPQWQPQAVCVTGDQMCPCPEVKGVKEDLALECHEGSSTRSTQYLSASFPSGLLAVALIQLPTVYFLGGYSSPADSGTYRYSVQPLSCFRVPMLEYKFCPPLVSLLGFSIIVLLPVTRKSSRALLFPSLNHIPTLATNSASSAS